MQQVYRRISYTLIFLPVLFLSLQLHARGVDSPRVTLNGAYSLLDAMHIIQKQVSMTFFYNNERIDLQKKIRCGLNDVPLEYALNVVFRAGDITWNIQNKTIILHKNTGAQIAITDSLPGKTTSGVVMDSAGIPLPGATIMVKGSRRGVSADVNGKFELKGINPDAIVVVSFTGFQKKEVFVNGKDQLMVSLNAVVGDLAEVKVVFTGYQELPKERATGSFTQVDEKLLSRSVSSDIVSRLASVTNSLLYDPANSGNTLGISVRGRSTIFASTAPLIVLDNFPYEGDISNINPNDVQSVTVLKDAAAASIWGTKAANGVIVITTKKGARNQPVKISLNTNFLLSPKPKLSQGENVSGSQYIDLEEQFFDLGYFDSQITDPSHHAYSPVVNLLNEARNGVITLDAAHQQIDALRGLNVRDDISKYWYRTEADQQYSLNISGGTATDKYYISGGYNKNAMSNVGVDYSRVSIDANNTYYAANNKLTINTNFMLTRGQSNSGPQLDNTVYPYTKYADGNGNPLAVNIYDQHFLDTVGTGHLLDWSLYPLKELRNKTSNSKATSSDNLVNIGLAYKIRPWINLDLKYQYGNGTKETKSVANQDSYNVRDLVNTYTDLDASDGYLTYGISPGAIFDRISSSYTSHYGRAAFNIDRNFGLDHQLTAIVGTEIRSLNTTGFSSRLYGYDPVHSTHIPVDFATYKTSYAFQSSLQVPEKASLYNLNDRYVSVFGNAAYTYAQKYTLSASARKDGSNLIGVNSNHKWAPLWSVGFLWNIKDERFFKSAVLSRFKLRTTYGFNGNIDKSTTALLVTSLNAANYFEQISSYILNPPNPNLRWEKIGQLNLAVDFGIFNDRISGSLDYYRKSGKNVIGNAPLAPSSGLTSYKGNTSGISGHGIDLLLTTQNIVGRISWTTSINFSYNVDKITKYNIQTTRNSDYPGLIVPIVGRPFSALYSYKWAGLSATNGDPQGYLAGKVSNDYADILSSNDPTSLAYNGRLVPPFFGNILNTISVDRFSLSFNITYKFGYYFRRNTIVYNDLFLAGTLPNVEIAKRWMNPGDEKTTNVPSLSYPFDPNRDNFYTNATVNVEKGGLIRLNDIQLSYAFGNKRNHRSDINVYVIGSNLGLLWKANHAGIDPDYYSHPYPAYSKITPPKNIAAGLKMTF